MRGRRVAGIVAFALALVLTLMLQAADPVAAGPPSQAPEDEGVGGFRSERGLRGVICSLPAYTLGPGACAPLLIFTSPLAVVGGAFAAGVRNPMILSGAGLVSMSAMAAVVMPAPIMIAGFVVASLGVTATLLLLRR